MHLSPSLLTIWNDERATPFRVCMRNHCDASANDNRAPIYAMGLSGSGMACRRPSNGSKAPRKKDGRASTPSMGRRGTTIMERLKQYPSQE